jgi:hypothetical protein
MKRGLILRRRAEHGVSKDDAGGHPSRRAFGAPQDEVLRANEKI